MFSFGLAKNINSEVRVAAFFCFFLNFSETLNPTLVAAASAAASTLPNSHQAESELLQQLRKHEAIPVTQRRADGQNIG